ncbi:MAG TPA: hypothetical protein VG122_15495 [Gemmata sp.]|nr:hypothetical protein [Gemmata sp.]
MPCPPIPVTGMPPFPKLSAKRTILPHRNFGRRERGNLASHPVLPGFFGHL